MEQPKVFEFAKELGMETLALMDKIREWKLPVKSHMATLDEDLLAEIKRRLTEGGTSEEAAPKKKTATRKAKAASSAPKPPKRPTTAAVRAKTEDEPKAEAIVVASEPVAEKPKKRTTKRAAGVIRRKASEVEARAQAQAEAEAQAKADAEAEAQAKAESEAEVQARVSEETGGVQELASVAASEGTPSEEGAGEPATPLSGAPTSETPAPAPRRAVRGNIIGRMDLRRVVNMSGGGSGPGAGRGGPQGVGPRTPRTAPRPMRTGFVAPMPLMEPPRDLFDDHERKLREEREKKKRMGAGSTGAVREEEQVFTATEFRKREVIFQPKKKKALTARDAKKTQITTPSAHKRVVRVNNTMTVSDLAMAMSLKAPQLIKKLMTDGIMATMNTELDFDTIALVAPEFGFEAVNVYKSVDELLETTAFGNLEAEPVSRPPVVTVMGHVDHGKTTLLDAIRKTDVAAGEAGGITQHIGAYTVTLEDGSHITFIDTPGHEAFTAMRARGANVTDIAIIVVAADDGLMPQTAEAINHAKAANVPIIVAVNKMDRPGANPDRIKQQLTEFELVPEEWGGSTIFCPVSALKREGVKELLEQVRLLAEMQDLKSNPERSATSLVIESRVEKGRGPIATVIVRDGTLKVGDVFVAGTVMGRIRSMMNDQGVQVREAGPGFAVEIMGLSGAAEAGDRLDVVKDEAMAEEIVGKRRSQKAAELLPKKLSLEEVLAKAKGSEAKDLPLLIKADVSGSLEAIRGLIDKSPSDKVKVKILHGAVGGITESDILLASTAGGVVIGFNVRPDGEAQRLAKEKNVDIRTYSIIYELMDDLKKLMTGMLDKVVTRKDLGRAEVRNTFVVPKIGTIAGCFIQDGKIQRGSMVRLVRDGRIVYEGKLSSLKRFKDDVREVASGFECGIGIENFNDIKVGDVIEAYTTEETAQEL